LVVAGAELQREESEMHYDLSARTRGDFDGRTNQPFGRCIVKVMYDDVNTNELSWPSKSMEQVDGHNMYCGCRNPIGVECKVPWLLSCCFKHPALSIAAHIQTFSGRFTALSTRTVSRES